MIRLATLGPDNAETATTVNDVAEMYRLQASGHSECRCVGLRGVMRGAEMYRLQARGHSECRCAGLRGVMRGAEMYRLQASGHGDWRWVYVIRWVAWLCGP